MKQIFIIICAILAVLAVFALAGSAFAAEPGVSIRANNSDGPITVPYNSNVVLAWSSYGADSCTASGDWSGTKAVFGSEIMYNVTSSKAYTITCTGSGVTRTDTVLINVDSNTNSTVDLWIANSNTNVAYNSYVTLNWTSNGSNNCYAYGAWSGTKGNNGSETVGPITSTRTYTLNCGNASDSVTVYVNNVPVPTYNPVYPVPTYNPVIYPTSGQIAVDIVGRNLSNGSPWTNTVVAQPGDVVQFQLRTVNDSNAVIPNVFVRDILPNNVGYIGRLLINGMQSNLDARQGINVGTLNPGESRVVIFEAQISGNFPVGQTKLGNIALAQSGNMSGRDDVLLCINRPNGSMASIASLTSTGITDNVFVDSFAIPFAIALAIVILFRSRIINWRAWLDNRKETYLAYVSEKSLKSKINTIRDKEFSSYHY